VIDPTPTIKGDYARTNPDEDELGRKQFCQKLARILATGHESGSTVVAIYGDWGVGKTTAKNFALHFLRTEHKIEPIEFEPWAWSGRDKIVEALFTRLEAGWVERAHVFLQTCVSDTHQQSSCGTRRWVSLSRAQARATAQPYGTCCHG